MSFKRTFVVTIGKYICIKLESVENTNGTRKRLDITLKGFLKFLEKHHILKVSTKRKSDRALSCSLHNKK